MAHLNITNIYIITSAEWIKTDIYIRYLAGGAANGVPLNALQNTRSRLAQLRIIFHGA